MAIDGLKGSREGVQDEPIRGSLSGPGYDAPAVETNSVAHTSLLEAFRSILDRMKKITLHRKEGSSLLKGFVQGLASPAYVVLDAGNYSFRPTGTKSLASPRLRRGEVSKRVLTRGGERVTVIDVDHVSRVVLGTKADLRSDLQRIGDDFRAVIRHTAPGRISKR